MPIYEYKHLTRTCKDGTILFELRQSIKEEALVKCPYCGGKIERVISKVNIITPTGNSKLKEKGFTKLVRRDKGVYENVTALKDEKRYFRADDPSSMPKLKKKISD